MTGYILALICLIALSAFFSAAEMSFSSANRVRLENAKERGSRAARAAVAVEERFDDALSAILIGNNLVNFAASSVASVMAILIAGEKWTWLATACVTLLIIAFGETVPKMVAKKNANRLALRFAYPIRGLMVLLTPLIRLTVFLVRLITRPLRGEEDDADDDAAVRELQSLIETAEDEAVLDEERSELLKAALDFDEISVSEAMTARVDVVAIDIEDDFESILATVDTAPFSRLPVYEGSIDKIIGVLYLNRFLKAMLDEPRPALRALLIEPLYMYKTIKLPQVLAMLRREKKHLAVVTDEYGGTLGIISLEDVLEQIVGDIWDETDKVKTAIVERPDGAWELDGSLTIGELAALVHLPEDSLETESTTVGGWTIENFGSFPARGDSFMAAGLRITVLAMDGLRVERVLAERLPEPGESEKNGKDGSTT